jgi:hypothetical protein
MIMNKKHKDKKTSLDIPTPDRENNPINSEEIINEELKSVVEDPIAEIHRQEMQEIVDAELREAIEDPLNNIQDELMQEIVPNELQDIGEDPNAEVYKEILANELQDIGEDPNAEVYKEIMQDELNAIITDELLNEGNSYLTYVVEDAKFKNIDQDIIKEFRMAKARKVTRSTFSLSNRSFQILKRLEEQYDYSPRMIFREAAQLPAPNEEILTADSNVEKNTTERKRKTFVLDSQSLETFTENAKRLNIPRDHIVDAHISALYHLLAQANHSEIELANKYSAEASNYDGLLSELASKAEDDFGSGHPITEGFSIAAVHLMNITMAIDNFLENGIWEDV